MFVLPSLSTFSRWPRDTMYGCMVTVSMPGTIRNHLLLDRYRELVSDLYCEPEDEVNIGNFLSPTEQAPERPQKRKKIVSVPEKEKIRSNDIRLLFKRQEEKNKSQDKSKEVNETIVID